MGIRFGGLFTSEIRFPFWRKLQTQWRLTPAANLAARREAKALMFAEMAEAARQGVPLEIALSLCSQNVREARNSLGLALPEGADTRDFPFKFLMAIVFLVMGHVALLIYSVMGSRYVDAERVSRILALRLHSKVSAGMPMSEAMCASGFDFDQQEVAIMRAGERWGKVPAALQTLADFQHRERDISVYAGQAAYPFYIIVLFAFPIGFVYWRILPKFQGIYHQLGGGDMLAHPLVRLTAAIMKGSTILSIPFLLIGLFLIARSLMNGSIVARILLVAPVFLTCFALLFPFLAVLLQFGSPRLIQPDGIMAPLVCMVAAILWLLISVPCSMLLIRPLERAVVSIERKAAHLVRHVFLVGAASRAQLDSRWMAALSLALESGVSEPEALRAAGSICGGRLSTRSHAAARLVEAGKTIGRACLEAKVLRPQIAHRLILLDGMSNYLRGMRQLADDSHERAFHLLARTGRITEVFGVLALGGVCLIVLLTFYMPIFGITPAVLSTME